MVPNKQNGKNLGPMKSKALLFFHSISGCDIVSAFKNKGEKFFFRPGIYFQKSQAHLQK